MALNLLLRLACVTAVVTTMTVSASNPVSRFMPGMNFPSHNLPGGGCDPVVSSNLSAAADCQHMCDSLSSCVMWTWVASGRQYPKSPWCCLKGCNNSDPESTCPMPAPENGTVSGVKDPQTYSQCMGPHCFTFLVDWPSGSQQTTFPTQNFSVRKVEAFVYPSDGKTYAYVDVVNYSDVYYPDSYSSEIGVYSSLDGRGGWTYHGIIIPRGKPGSWDGGGVASPGGAVASDGTVLVAYAAENAPNGGRNRGIGFAIAPHPLGPFTKQIDPVASPSGICGGTGRCDDVIMQSRPGNEIHLYHSVKSSNVVTGGDSIHHRMTKDAGKTWSTSTMVLQRKNGFMETIAGKYFPKILGGDGGMVLITDGGPNGALTPFISANMSGAFVSSVPPIITECPTGGLAPGKWANSQIAFIPDANGTVSKVLYTLWNRDKVYSKEHNQLSLGYSATVYKLSEPPNSPILQHRTKK